jgi:hypothetical protein
VIAELAARQYGVVARFQLFAMGLKRGMMDGRIRRRTLHPIHNAVYAVGHPSIARQGHYMDAVLAGGEDAVLSHRSAGMHWGITRFGGRNEITVPSPRRRRHPFVARSSSLAPDEITIHENIPITTPAENLPVPELNGTLELPAMTIEPDAMWRDRRLIVELDSWSAHGTQSAFERDRKRDLALAAAGWLSVRITWHGLDGGIPQDLRSLLAQ